jgi:hypothetical protein
MEVKLMQDFKDYLKEFNVKDIQFSSSNTQIVITASMWKYDLLIDSSLIPLAIYGTYTVDDKRLFLLPILAAWTFVAYLFWSDFNYINQVKLDLFSKKMEVISRNIFKRLVFKTQKYNFNEVSAFKVRSSNPWNIDRQKYFVDASIKGKSTIVLVSFVKEERAYSLANFLKTLISN